MRAKLSPRDLKPSPYPPHSTSTYTYGITIALRVRGGNQSAILMCRHLILHS